MNTATFTEITEIANLMATRSSNICLHNRDLDKVKAAEVQADMIAARG